MSRAAFVVQSGQSVYLHALQAALCHGEAQSFPRFIEESQPRRSIGCPIWRSPHLSLVPHERHVLRVCEGNRAKGKDQTNQGRRHTLVEPVFDNRGF
ncbi:hypothetical protein HYQ45_005373 [Verticillium longisporum]|uniref:Uncharacterized protein n=1 Tax=Verticillium longisporum TaxID=100787 RepID=A0A8I2ZUL6_VERLO|nr:hypothetical protein HYQ45_005373 [Verticillium longisporum]